MASTINGRPLLVAHIQEPAEGFWVADVAADADDLTGAVTMSIEGVEFIGSVYRGGGDAGRWKGRIVGGSAARSTATLAAKYYLGATVSTIVADILSATGDTLDGSSDSTVLSGVLARWHRSEGSAGKSWTAIASAAGACVRSLRSGALYFGALSYPDIEDPSGIVEVDRVPQSGSRLYGLDAPNLAPAVTFRDRRVSYVSTMLTPGMLRQRLWFD